jgi:hypothetical protein
MKKEEHIKIAKDLHKLHKVVYRMYEKQKKVSEKDLRTYLNIRRRLQCRLDTDYLKSVNDEQFDKLGYIYYVQK